MKWSMRPLSALGTVQTGSTPSTSEARFWGGDVPFVTPAELEQRTPITNTPRTLTDDGSREGRLVREGAVLVCCIGSLGKIGIAGRSLVTNQQINSVEFDPRLVFPKYGYYACRRLKSQLIRMAPATTVPIVNKSKFEQLEIPVPPIPEQIRIAAILDQADALRVKRRDALAQMDSLTQSIFIEMFGDPAINPKGINQKPLGDLIKLKSGNFLPATDMVGSGSYPVFGGNGINGCHDKFMFSEPQIIIGRVGVYCGCVHVSPPTSWVTDNALYVSESAPQLNFGYLAYSLKQAKLNQYASQSAQPLISGARLYPVKILVPTLEQQCEFTGRVAAVEKLRNSLHSSLSELDSLFSSLQHRAFRGEL